MEEIEGEGEGEGEGQGMIAQVTVLRARVEN